MRGERNKNTQLIKRQFTFRKNKFSFIKFSITTWLVKRAKHFYSDTYTHQNEISKWPPHPSGIGRN